MEKKIWWKFKRVSPKSYFAIGNSSGFSLIEVLIALTIFAVFITAYVVSQGGNLSDSAMIQEELTLQNLCESKLNEIILNPPRFEKSLTLMEETKSFEDDYSNYEFSVKYEQLHMPDLSAISGANKGADGQGEAADDKDSMIQKKVLQEISKNLDEMIWQVRVKVRNKSNGYNYELSTWLRNYDAKPKINI
ncbi:MAG: prepilin-type N-terminal cleavage/methylation domain-containing protein [Bacteriovoracaceae bacterium]